MVGDTFETLCCDPISTRGAIIQLHNELLYFWFWDRCYKHWKVIFGWHIRLVLITYSWDFWCQCWSYIYNEIIKSVSNERLIIRSFIIIYKLPSWFNAFTDLSLAWLSSKFYEDYVDLRQSWIDNISFLLVLAESEAYSCNSYTLFHYELWGVSMRFCIIYSFFYRFFKTNR